jgi:hypothetical protein
MELDASSSTDSASHRQAAYRHTTNQLFGHLDESQTIQFLVPMLHRFEVQWSKQYSSVSPRHASLVRSQISPKAVPGTTETGAANCVQRLHLVNRDEGYHPCLHFFKCSSVSLAFRVLPVFKSPLTIKSFTIFAAQLFVKLIIRSTFVICSIKGSIVAAVVTWSRVVIGERECEFACCCCCTRFD